MGSDQSYLYGEHSMLKLIEDPASIRLKVCPSNGEGFDEVDAAVSFDLDRTQINTLIRDLRKHRDRLFGRDE